MTILYGIKNCDTVKKARKWLDQQGVDYRFHDFRADGLERKKLEAFTAQVATDLLINKRSTTWKQLDNDARSHFEGESLSPQAQAIVLAQPTLLKRPLLEHQDQLQVGFNPDHYAKLFS